MEPRGSGTQEGGLRWHLGGVEWIPGGGVWGGTQVKIVGTDPEVVISEEEDLNGGGSRANPGLIPGVGNCRVLDPGVNLRISR